MLEFVAVPEPAPGMPERAEEKEEASKALDPNNVCNGKADPRQAEEANDGE